MEQTNDFKKGITYVVSILSSLIEDGKLPKASFDYLKNTVTTNNPIAQTMAALGFSDGAFYLHQELIKQLKEEGYEFNN